ncbi:MAG TPA: ribosome maturation factor RimM [Bacillales bacterium]|nr:ribosome maturation factor RimM [Bacillales bacterium]
MAEWLDVGKITKPHGLKGEVRVLATTDFPDERFAEGNMLYLQRGKGEAPTPLVIETRRRHKQFELLRFEGYPNINDVESWKGARLKVPEDELVSLEEDEFYYHEIIGCLVVTEEGEELGKIKEIIETGANDVWVVKRTGGKDLLIPFIDEVVKEINVDEKLVKIHVMEGLFE